MSTHLDHAATSPMCSEAQDALLTELGRVGNPSSQHRAEQWARRRPEEAREEPAAALGAHPGEVIFTSGGSEADSIAILGSLTARLERPRSLISAVEHPAVQEARGRGAEVLAVNSRRVVEDTTWEAADEKVVVISVVKVNNETGVIHLLDGLIAVSSRTGVWSHSDTVQVLRHVPLGFHATGLDLMSVSTHKIGGPIEIGALAVRRGVTPAPIGFGGGQEGRIRSGTPPVTLTASFVAAATAAMAGPEAESERLIALWDGIHETASACGGHINGENCAPHIVSVTFPGIRAQDLLFLLDAEDTYASAGSACRAGVCRPSEVLLVIGVPEDEAMSTVRFSSGHTSGRGDVDRFREVLPVAVERARVAGWNFSAADPEKGGELKVLAAMSGGVDSAVAAVRPVAAGCDVIGVYLALNRNPQPYREGSRGCYPPEDAHDARHAADLLDIPFYVWGFSEQFQTEVVDDFIVEYRAGRTPNPRLGCNEKIKFAAVLECGPALGFDAVATGHYAQVMDNGSELELHRAADLDKDQSYALGMLNQDQLRRSLFPLASTPKPQVRAEAHSLGLRVTNKPNSYDICFIPDGDAQGYLRAHLGETPGPIMDRSGTEFGRHRGHHGFTIGQRKGLDLHVPAPDGNPRYVLRIEPASNRVVIGPGESLLVINLAGIRPTWAQHRVPGSWRGQVQYRVHGVVLSATITTTGDDQVRVELDEPTRGMAPGQFMVFFDATRVVGSATISGTS